MAEQDIRNVIQTHQERPIIKMAPDMVVYIDGLPFVINDYIGDGGVVVSFNDFVVSAQGAADTETFIPACTVSLSVPVDLRSLFQAPGGNRILRAMSEVKIFAKGYYLTAEGDSVYHRVFWGVITTVSYADNKKTLDITLSCKGILHLFDLMQTNVAPSVANAEITGSTVTPMITKDSNLGPFGIILSTFMSPLKADVIDQTTVAYNMAKQDVGTFRRVYIAKWNVHLLNLQKAIRLFGFGPKKLEDSPKLTEPAEKHDSAGVSTETKSGAETQKLSETQRQSMVIDAKMIKQFLPDFRIGSINLTQSNIVSRLSRVKAQLDAIGWEGYQDIDGCVIMKPPLYNLDTTLTDQNPERNPFIIHLSEVIGTETEMEDESQVRLTRLEVMGTLGSTPIVEANENILPKASFMDPGLVRQFGLRQEPPRKMEMIANHSYALFAYAVAELNKMNRRWRTYSVTIPFRPELRLGFPIFVPHLDIYAYLENISWSYTRGGQCTMTLSTTSVRWREMFGKQQEDPATKTKSWVYTAVPDLTFAWTTEGGASAPDSKGRITDPKGTTGTQKSEADPTPEQKQQVERQKILQNLMAVEGDTAGASWRVQDDKDGFFKTAKPVDDTYYEKVKKAMPYTDAKGYILVRPFPWGRFIKLEDALDMFTRPPEKQTKKLLPFEAKDKPKDATASPTQGTSLAPVVRSSDKDPIAYLMSGLGTPSLSSTDPTKGTTGDNAVLAKLNTIHDMISPNRADPAQKDADAIICFTLSYDEAFDTSTLAKDLNSMNAANAAGSDMALPAAGRALPPPEEKAEDFVRGTTLNGETWEGAGGFSQ